MKKNTKKLKIASAVVAGVTLFTGILVGIAEGQYGSLANVDNYNYDPTRLVASHLDKYYMDEIFPMVGENQFSAVKVSYLQATEPYNEFSWGTLPAYLSPAGFGHRDALNTYPDDHLNELRNGIADISGEGVMAYCNLVAPISELENPHADFQKYKDKTGAPLEDKEAHELRIKENKSLGLPITFDYARDYIGTGIVTYDLQVSAAEKGSAVRDSITKLNTYCGVAPENLESAEKFVLEEFAASPEVLTS